MLRLPEIYYLGHGADDSQRLALVASVDDIPDRFVRETPHNLAYYEHLVAAMPEILLRCADAGVVQIPEAWLALSFCS